MSFTQQEAIKLQKYLNEKFGNKGFVLKPRPKADDSVELLLDGEFLGTVYKDGEEGDISYDINISILDIDIN